MPQKTAMTDMIRWATAADYDELGRVMYDAVRNGASLYDEAQRAAWIEAPRTDPEWRERLARQAVIVEADGPRIAGFLSLAPDGYVDFAYVRAPAQGRGLFRRLYERLQDQALADGLAELSTHASLMARPAFAAVGFHVVKPERIEMRGQWFDRFEMRKSLVNGHSCKT